MIEHVGVAIMRKRGVLFESRSADTPDVTDVLWFSLVPLGRCRRSTSSSFTSRLTTTLLAAL
jgi:hypothetical protein